MTRVAALDCGTNATRLLVADVESGRVREVLRTLRLTRMGERLDETGVLAPASLGRVREALVEHRREAERLGASRTGVLATSAAREAANSSDFVGVVRDVLGVEPTIVTGDEEAARTHAGALEGLEVPEPALVVDLGGGSTEVALRCGGEVATTSTSLGSVRLRERHLGVVPVAVSPTPDQLSAVSREVHQALDEVPQVDVGSADSVVAVGGTALTLAAIYRAMPDPDDARLHACAVPARALRQLAEALVWAPTALTAARPQVEPGREDVLGVGALVLSILVDRVAAEALVVSRHDLLDDLARRLADS